MKKKKSELDKEIVIRTTPRRIIHGISIKIARFGMHGLLYFYCIFPTIALCMIGAYTMGRANNLSLGIQITTLGIVIGIFMWLLWKDFHPVMDEIFKEND